MKKSARQQDLTFRSHDGDFHYIDWGGTGPLTHIAHATGLCAGVYTEMAQRLLAHLKVLGLDFRGHGQTNAHAHPKQLRNWNVFYADLESFFKYLGHPVIAIGHSLGGTASMMVAACRPEMVQALIMIEPGIMPPSWRLWVYLAQKTGLFRFVPFVTRASKKNRTWPDSQAARDRLRGKGPFRQWKGECLESYIKEGMVKRGDGSVSLACDPAWEGRCLAMAPYDIWQFVPHVKAPTLVLYGSRSTTFLPSVVRTLEVQLPHAVIERFEKTGHFIPMECPDECAEKILGFLRDNSIVF